MTEREIIWLVALLVLAGLITFCMWYHDQDRCPYCRSRHVHFSCGKRPLVEKWKCERCGRTWEDIHIIKI